MDSSSFWMTLPTWGARRSLVLGCFCSRDCRAKAASTVTGSWLSVSSRTRIPEVVSGVRG